MSSSCIRPRLTTCTWSMTAWVFSMASSTEGEDGGDLELLGVLAEARTSIRASKIAGAQAAVVPT